VNILLTVHQFFPHFSSGTEVLTLSTARELRRRGHLVEILAGYPAREMLDDSSRFDHYVYDGFSVHRFHHAYVPMGGQQDIMEAEYDNTFVAGWFRDLVARLKPDFVHFFHLSRLSASLVDVCVAQKIPTVLTATDFWFICPTSQLRLPDDGLCQGPSLWSINCIRHISKLHQPASVSAALERTPAPLLAAGLSILRLSGSKKWPAGNHALALTRRASHLASRINKINRVLAPTRLMAQLLTANGAEAGRVSVCPYGIALEHSRSSQRPARTEGQPLRIGFIGTLYDHKGAHVLLEAVASIPKARVTVDIYGRLEDFPEYTNRLKGIAADDERIRFKGTFLNSEIASIFEQLDVLVVPSVWYENTPLVIHSAQAFCCPVIASDLGGMSESVRDAKDGLLFEPGNSAELGRLINRLADDPSIVATLSTGCRPPRTAEDYVDELERIYADVARSRPQTEAEPVQTN